MLLFAIVLSKVVVLQYVKAIALVLMVIPRYKTISQVSFLLCYIALILIIKEQTCELFSNKFKPAGSDQKGYRKVLKIIFYFQNELKIIIITFSQIIPL